MEGAWLLLCFLQRPYKKDVKDCSSSLYHLMPETLDTLVARQQTDAISEVRPRPPHLLVLLRLLPLFLLLLLCIHIPQFILVSSSLFQLKYKEDGKKEMNMNLYSLLPETLDTQHAKEQSQSQSQVLTPPIAFHRSLTGSPVADVAVVPLPLWHLSSDTRRPVESRGRRPCTTSWLRRWRHSTPERRLSSRVR